MTDPKTAIHLVHFGVLAAFLTVLGTQGTSASDLWASDWGLPFVVMNLGIFLGNIAFGWLSQRPDASVEVAAQSRKNDLEHNRAVVLQQLKNLEVEKDKLDPEDYERERSQLVQVGAAAGRALDTQEPPMPATPEDETTDVKAALERLQKLDPSGFDDALQSLGLKRDPLAFWRGAGTAGLLTALALGLFLQAGSMSRDRRPGATITGGDQVDAFNETPEAATPAPSGLAQDDPRTPLVAQLEANPDDVAILNQLTELSLTVRDLSAALQYNQRALSEASNDPDALTFQNVLRFFIGRVDEALAGFEEVLTAHPNHGTTLVYYGLIAMESCKAELAIQKLEAAVALRPNATLQQALTRARGIADGSVPCEPIDMMGGPAAGPPTPAGRPAPEVLVAGTINAPAMTPGAILFVSIRDPAGGPPLGALRLEPTAFPMSFELTTANLLPMGGGRPVPDQLQLTARLDSDGDPMTRPPSDPTATLTTARGSAALELTLEAQ